MSRLHVFPATRALSSEPEGPSFEEALDAHGVDRPRRAAVSTLQINVGKRCNQACHHCHVDAGPKRTEALDARTAARLVELARRSPRLETVDITGGAPELNHCFRDLVVAMRRLGLSVIDRCNLTILSEPGMEDLAEFLAAQRVRVIASLPCYGRDNVDRQRGRGVFDRSVEALHRLNALGYGRDGSGLELDLVYNPGGAFLPPAQEQLEASYKRELRELGGIEFNRLLTLANMPINRFARALEREGGYAAYMSLLVNHFNAATVDQLMCRAMVSVGYDGALHDCDFNQMLGLPLSDATGAAATVWTLESFDELEGGCITTAPHCLGCTAGAGSSCGGALA